MPTKIPKKTHFFHYEIITSSAEPKLKKIPSSTELTPGRTLLRPSASNISKNEEYLRASYKERVIYTDSKKKKSWDHLYDKSSPEPQGLNTCWQEQRHLYQYWGQKLLSDLSRKHSSIIQLEKKPYQPES